jgi:Putative DNA-binding domain
MSELLELQRRVAAAIMHPLTKNETMPHRRRDGIANNAEAEALIKPNDRLSSFERLEIYNRQYWFRLYSSFEEDFPGLKAILGGKKFDKLMRDYLTARPSESFSLRNLGAHLEAWLLAHPEYLEPRGDLALDMVRLEWAHIETFDSGEEPVIDADDLASIDETSRLRLQPCLHVLELKYPVDDLLIALRSESGSSDSSSNNASVARKTRRVRKVAMLAPEQIFLAAHRHANSVYYKRLHREEYRLLQSLLSGNPIGEAIDFAFEDSTIPEDDRGASLQQAFASWATLGWFTR